jgi:hypothetical protein
MARRNEAQTDGRETSQEMEKRKPASNASEEVQQAGARLQRDGNAIQKMR